nr:hypothetical protein JVH1_0793 [Rhodococcus sp. JVH1]
MSRLGGKPPDHGTHPCIGSRAGTAYVQCLAGEYGAAIAVPV